MVSSQGKRKAQLIYISHGGGPLPILGEPSHKKMVEFLEHLPMELNRPESILVISAHWEEQAATVTGGSTPDLFYDYYGFPKEAYSITYAAPGNPPLAAKIANMLHATKIPTRIDSNRGFDHGVFIPLKLMFPKADIPVLQLSLIRGLNPAQHIALGKGLRALLQENVLVIGSGFSFHNLQAFSMGETWQEDEANAAFQNWLIRICTGLPSQAERERELIGWEKAPSARYCHPREEHLLPLHVCAAMAEAPARLIFDDQILGKRSVAFAW